MLNDRDKRILQSVSEFGALSSRQIKNYFFIGKSRQYGCRRLKQYVDAGLLKRLPRDFSCQSYVYYDRSIQPKQIPHRLMVFDAYTTIERMKEFQFFRPLPTNIGIGSILPDAIFQLWYENKIGFDFFLECQTTTKLDQQKYVDAYLKGDWRDRWYDFPTIIVLCENKTHIKESPVQYVQTKLSDLQTSLQTYLRCLYEKGLKNGVPKGF